MGNFKKPNQSSVKHFIKKFEEQKKGLHFLEIDFKFEYG